MFPFLFFIELTGSPIPNVVGFPVFLYGCPLLNLEFGSGLTHIQFMLIMDCLSVGKHYGLPFVSDGLHLTDILTSWLPVLESLF